MRYTPFAMAAVVSMSIHALADAPSTTQSTIDLTPDTTPKISASDAVDTVREGTHFVGRTGRLQRTTDDHQAMMIFDNTAGATNSPPMIVLPNLNLFLMESVTAGKSTPVDFRISGTVTEYKGRNYILLDNAQTTLVSPAPVATTQANAASAPTQPVFGGMKNDSAVSKMERLLAPPPDSGRQLPALPDNAPATNVTTGIAAVAPDAPVLKVMREGTHLINRIGRLNHSRDGNQAIFTFDTDSKTMGDPPMIILPNLKLTAMEAAIQGRAGDLHFRVSGTVTEYKGRNYILLDKAVAIADVEVPF